MRSNYSLSDRSKLAAFLLAVLLPASSLFAPPTPTPTPSPTPRPTERPTPTPTPAAPKNAPKFEVSSSEIRREPFSLVGRVESRLGDADKVATGAIGARRVVISAAEVLWSEETGFASKVIFRRGQLGSEVLQSTRATFIVLLSSFTKTDARVDSNVAAILFKNSPGPGVLDLQPARDYLTSDYRNFMLGYFGGIGNGKRMAGLSEISFRPASGTLLFRPKNVKEFPELSLGAPVFHGISTSAGFRPVFVGTVVSQDAVRGFSARLIRDLQE